MWLVKENTNHGVLFLWNTCNGEQYGQQATGLQSPVLDSNYFLNYGIKILIGLKQNIRFA
jgi:hypothetical protein